MKKLNKNYWYLSVFFFLIVSGCSTLQPIKDEEAIGHVISIGRDGCLEEIKPGEKIKLDPGEELFDQDDNVKINCQPSFDLILDGIQRFPKNSDGEIEVLIYVHGGLNTKESALERAQEKYKEIKYSDVEKKYPIFINWRSGPVTTYSSHLTRIRQGDISSTAPLTSPIYFLTDVGNSLINIPKSWFVTGEHSLDSTFFRDDEYLEKYKKGDNGVLFTGDLNDYSTFGRSFWWVVTSPAKLITTPFTYTMARPAWDIMLRRTNTLFYKPSDLQNGNHDDGYGSEMGTGALSVFLLQMEALIKTKKLPVKITLIGHSMGAIVVNKMVNMDIELPYENIVHMASADSIKNLFEQVVPYLSVHDANFYSLSLHPENEDREVSAWGLTPSGSLLVWIDDMFTSPETVLDKRSGRWENMERVLKLIPDNARKKMYFKIYGLNDSGLEPQKHGEFGDLSFWLKETWWK